MINNILKSKDLKRITLKYTDKNNYYEYPVTLRYMDDTDCYLSADSTPDFVKPAKVLNAEILAYTPKGIYSSKVKIHDTCATLKELSFLVTTPQKWTNSENRNGYRVKTEIPVILEFSDGFKIDTITEDIAVNGISFYCPKSLDNKYKKEYCQMTVVFPDGTFGNGSSGTIARNAKFLREDITYDFDITKFFYVFKFTSLKVLEIAYIKQFLNNIEQKNIEAEK